MTNVVATAGDFTQPFWDGAEQHRLVYPHCARCDRAFFTPQLICPGCQRPEWEWRPSSGRGTVYSHTTVYRAPVEGFQTPYVLAVVDLVEGWSMLTTIVDCPPERVAIGDAVEVRWIRSRGRALPAFAPVPSS